MKRQLSAAILFLSVCPVVADFTVEHRVAAVPVKVRINDSDNAKAYKTFDLKQGQKKTMQLKCRHVEVRVYDKKSLQLLVKREVPASTQIVIEEVNGHWLIRRVDKNR